MAVRQVVGLFDLLDRETLVVRGAHRASCRFPPEMRAPPFLESQHQRPQGSTMPGQFINDSGRHLREYRAGEDSFLLELAQMEGKHVLADARYRPLELIEPAGSTRKLPENQYLPLTFENGESRGNFRRRLLQFPAGAGVWIAFCHDFPISHVFHTIP